MIETKLPRVLMFCGQFWPKICGAERQALNLSRALIGRGCHVEVLTAQLETIWPLEEVRDGLRINRFPFVDLTTNLKGVRGSQHTTHGYWIRQLCTGTFRISIFSMDILRGPWSPTRKRWSNLHREMQSVKLLLDEVHFISLL